ncbi:MAG: putative ATP-binding protein involved in virulence [Flammeovirgaceae bacterium]|jgi:predicted ATP-binding protein involved in virulence
MQIKDIHIQNLRGFEDEKIEFHPNLNVFIGSNASGKTTILEAVLDCCYQLVDKAGIDRGKNSFSKRDINYSKEWSLVTSNAVIYLDGKETELSFAYKLGLEKDESFLIYFFNSDRSMSSLSFGESGEPKTLPIIKYYPPHNDATKGYLQKERKSYETSQLESWEYVYHNRLSYTRFLEWFVNYENQELREKSLRSELSYEMPILRFVRQAVSFALKEIYNKELIVRGDSIKLNNNNELFPTLVIQERKGIATNNEYLNQKSDGEIAIITLVADIAYNLAIAKDFENDDEGFLTASRGVVMIDEIETHLHPNWQRKIVPILRKVFPNIQFFITTHSPQVVSSVASESVFVCEDFKVNKVNFRTKGTDTNTLLKYIFNSTERPQKYIDALKEFGRKIDEKADEKELIAIIDIVKKYRAEDDGEDIDLLVEDMMLQLEAHNFDMEYEMD